MITFKQTINESVLSEPLYRENWFNTPPRIVANLSITISSELATALENIADEYMKEIGLTVPIRMDLWIDEDQKCVPFEINTWFVDQFGSGLNVLEAFEMKEQFEKSLEIFAKLWRWDKIFISLPQYTREVELMCSYLASKWKKVEIISNEKEALEYSKDKEIFCYGYPTEEMRGNKNIIPWGLWLDAEDKFEFYEFLDVWMSKKQEYRNIISSLLRYNPKKRAYNSLQWELVRKQVWPKIKWNRCTVMFAKPKKGTEREYLYTMGQTVAQETLSPFVIQSSELKLITKDEEGKVNISGITDKIIVELRALLLPDDGWYKLSVVYWLLWKEPGSQLLINDSNPQCPCEIK